MSKLVGGYTSREIELLDLIKDKMTGLGLSILKLKSVRSGSQVRELTVR